MPTFRKGSGFNSVIAVLTHDETMLALELRISGNGPRQFMCPRRIARFMGGGVTEYGIQRALGMKTRKLLVEDFQNDKTPISYGNAHEICPDYVLAERERRRLLDHPTLTARLMGDPLPKYSALDKRNG